MRVLVTGGCGFIGSHLADRLVADGHAVTILDNLSTGHRANAPKEARIVEGDISDEALVPELVAAADAVFHLAAIASVQVCEQEPERAAQTNMRGTEIIFAAASHQKTPVIYASSAAVYGDNPNLPLSETETPAPLSAYGRHKLANEQTAAAFAAHGLPSVGLRFFNVYGPRQDPRSPYSGVISKFVASIGADQPITMFGDGKQTRDFIFVSDIIELLICAWSHAKGAMVVNGCTGQSVNLQELAAAVGLAMHKEVKVIFQPARAGDIRHSLGDPTKARTLLDFNAKYSLAMGWAND